ncbi:MAG: DUF115 domain-containing protein [Treponema sp.]|jgi:hypothetical protein|nr:DUF115 domain-containing protein [Treponema sp.]
MDKICYTPLKARCGETVPALVLPSGDRFPLHSMVDPKREARRLVSTIPQDTGFIIFLGLGGGFAAREALRNCAAKVIAIEYNNESVSSLLSIMDFSELLNNKHFTLLIDPSSEKIKNLVLENYRPALCGGIKTIPLRARTEHDAQKFGEAAAAIELAIESVACDYSVQAHFGRRWFSNIIRNIKAMDSSEEGTNLYEKADHLQVVNEAAIAAAGPSLDSQLSLLAEFKLKGGLLISSDTALPVLLYNNIKPDIAVSIDCQHISYYHFSRGAGSNVPLILDIASPPLLRRFSSSVNFFSGGHPLSLYISRHWRRFPVLDASGGNVTYACLSLAEYLGAKRITLFGADFSYVRSRAYARGTYIYPFFEKKQNRLSPVESLFSAFLYRSPFLPKEKNMEQESESADQVYHETASLRFYRKKLEEKAEKMTAQVISAKGQGAPIHLNNYKITTNNEQNTKNGEQSPEKKGKTAESGVEFLEKYRREIAALPAAGTDGAESGYLDTLCVKDREIFMTLLPLAAWLKHRNSALNTGGLIEEVKRFCIREIERLLE